MIRLDEQVFIICGMREGFIHSHSDMVPVQKLECKIFISQPPILSDTISKQSKLIGLSCFSVLKYISTLESRGLEKYNKYLV